MSMVRILMIAALVGCGLAQTTHPPEDNSHPAAVAATAAMKNSVESAVAPGDAVLTVHGICPPSQTAFSVGAEDCTVVVKRQQFDDLMKIVAPGQGATAVKHSLAKTYTDLLALDSAAKKLGIDTSSQFLETMEWLRVRTLADMYRRSMEKESSAVSEEEIDQYYHEHILQFEEAKLRRIVLPRNNFAAADRQEFEKKALQIATDIRERAAKGEDLDELQHEAYKALGFDGIPPATEVGNRRRTGLTPEVSDDLFSLRPGEISKVEKETYSFGIYKVEEKWTQPRQRVREEIVREVAKRKLETTLKSVTGDVRAELNEKYFGAPPEQ